MRPISVEFQAFGPYKEKEVIDFEALAAKGLFLICGETGSGKTMILDAITYALYGKSSGNGREDLQSSRCKYTPWGVDTYVDFKFEANGKVYRFERRLECKRSNLSLKHNVYVLNDNGIYEPIFENCKDTDMKKKALELIGMDYDQFRQVILLPQGQFEKLLTASSEEKEQVLVNIFGVDKWSIIAKKLYENAEAKLNELRRIKAILGTRLMDEECSSVEEFLESIDKLRFELLELNKTFEEQGYDNKKLEFEEIKAILSSESEAKNNLEERIENEKVLHEQMEDKAKSVLVLQKAYEGLCNEKNVIEDIKVEITRYEDKREYYEGLDILEKNLITENNNLINCEEALNNKRNQLQLEKKKQLEIGKELKNLNEEYSKLMSLYINGVVGALAKDLKDGVACPVCGSTKHPHKAEFTIENVSKVEVDAKKKEAEKKEKSFEKENILVQSLEEEVLRLTNSFNKQSNAVKMAEQELEHHKSKLLKGISTISDLERLIKSKKKSIDEYDIKLQRSMKELDQCKRSQADLEGKIKAAIEEIKKAEDKYNDCKSNLTKFFENKKDNITIEECDEELKRISIYQQEYSASKARYQLLIDNKCKKVDELKAMDEQYKSQWNQAEADLRFAKNLRGDTGIGLQRYVLGIMFSSVISAANQMLEKVHGGRYRLFRTDEKVKGSNKKGLELYVYDSFVGSEEGRSVKTLSGGEKFLVSLALSIGLSTVARRSGIKLDAMFIDEGFGSLDQNSIEDAMDILLGIQKANGVVGIISHVQILKDNIPTKIEIIKSKNGSKIIKD